MSAELVTLTIDGKEITVPKGTLIIRAAEQLGVQIPRFCDHPLLEPAGACRQCFVEVEGQRKLLTSCTTTVAEGMVVRTQNTSEDARSSQVSNIEFLLLNHPLDCPVCDRGGECPLQDQALEFGPGASRFTEAKRTYPKPLPLSPLVGLDRERCVLCARCTRFCDEISGDRQIQLLSRGAREQVGIAAGEEFNSPFSGNTIQICPVGALTATSYRFAARPFDLRHVDTVCGHCASGCNVRVDLRRDEVVRVLARDEYAVNDAWICDKGRFAFGAADAPERITTPLLRTPGLEPVSFGEVTNAIRAWIEQSAGRVAFLTGGRLTDEDNYALAKLARVTFGTNDVDHRRRGSAGGVEVFAATPRPADEHVTYQDIETAKVIVVAGLDTEQELPILHLRIRKAVRKHKARVVVVHPRRTRLHDVAEHLLAFPGEEAAAITGATDLMQALRDAGPDAIVLGGERLGDVAGAADAVRTVAAETGARFAWAARRAGDPGALRAGVHPALLPGGRRVEDEQERGEVEAIWGAVPGAPGRDTRQILEAAAAKEIDVLFLVGIDPARDFPDAALVQRALANTERVVVQGLELGSLAFVADAFLPAAASIEKDGHFTTWEGRGQRLRPARAPLGSAQADWELFEGLARAMGASLGFSSLAALRAELGGVLAPRGASEEATSSSSTSAATDGLSGEELVLFTYPLLVDEGRLSEGTDLLKEGQEQPAFVEIELADARERSITDGQLVRLRTEAGEALVPARVTEHVMRGTVFVPFNNPGLAANTLLSGSFVTRVTVEAAETVTVAAAVAVAVAVADVDADPADAADATAEATSGEGA